MIYHKRPAKDSNPKKKLGLVHVYTGEGKGKTTAALGTMMRAAGHGYRSTMIRFIRGFKDTGEMKALGKFNNLIEILAFAQEETINLADPKPLDKHLVYQAMDYTRKIMREKRPDVLVLDEINPIIHYGLLSVAEVLEFLDNKHQETEVILTGQFAHPDLLNYADLVTVMQSPKHYFDKEEYLPRLGIEY